MNMGSCSFSDPPLLPRLKATLERCLRLTEGYTDVLLEVLPERAGQLGRALGVEDWVVRTFTEGEVRASLVFQLSKFGPCLFNDIRTSLIHEPFRLQPTRQLFDLLCQFRRLLLKALFLLFDIN